VNAPPDLSGLPKPPDKPEPYECCERGCCPCIFDYYWDALDRWKAVIRERGADPEAVLKVISGASSTVEQLGEPVSSTDKGETLRDI
jgi:hypothetical protein